MQDLVLGWRCSVPAMWGLEAHTVPAVRLASHDWLSLQPNLARFWCPRWGSRPPVVLPLRPASVTCTLHINSVQKLTAGCRLGDSGGLRCTEPRNGKPIPANAAARQVSSLPACPVWSRGLCRQAHCTLQHCTRLT